MYWSVLLITNISINRSYFGLASLTGRVEHIAAGTEPTCSEDGIVYRASECVYSDSLEVMIVRL